MKKLWGGKKSLCLVCAVVTAILAAITAANAVLDQKMDLGSEDSGEDAVFRYHIAMISSDPYDDFWLSVYEGANETGKEKDIYVENFGENLDRSYPVEDLMEMAIAAQVDGILVEADQSKQMAALIDEATKEGIPVMTVLSDAPDSSRISFVSGYNYALGELYGGQIVEEAKERLSELPEGDKLRATVLLNSGDKNSAQNLIYAGIRETAALKESPVRLETASVDGSGEFKSEETLRELVLGDNCPDLLICLSAVDTISAYQCVVDYNMVGKVSIIGYYGSEDILKEIEKGIVKSTISINTREMGRVAAEGMWEYLTNAYVSEYLPVAAELITAENVEEYMDGDDL